MIDLSDGLLVDAGRVARASGCGIAIAADRLPLAGPLAGVAPSVARALAVGGGEDYELLFTVPRHREARLRALALGCPLTMIGEVVRGRGVALVDAAGRRIARHPAGYEHFRR
jgi:thiamine-monophosphate kinase